MPAGVKKMRLYIGDVLELSEFRLKHMITEKELIFTCYNKSGKNCEAQTFCSYAGYKRKRAVKSMAKRKTVEYVSEDSTQMKSVSRYLRKIWQVKQYSQCL
jgi:hypothetical protein